MFPIAVLTNVFKFLSPADVKHGCMLVSKEWQEAAEDPLLWRNVTARIVPKDFKPEHLTTILPIVLRSLIKKSIASISFHEKCSGEQIKTTCGVLGAQIKKLSLRGCKVLTEEEFLEVMQLTPQISEINLSGCSFVQGSFVNHFSTGKLDWFWKNLVKINLGHTCYEMPPEYSHALKVISKQCSDLRAVGLAGCKGHEILSLINNIHIETSITALDLSFTDIEDEVLISLSKNDKLELKEFNITSCKSLSDTFHDSLKQLLKAQPNLNILKLSNLKISFPSLLPALSNLSQLTYLDMNSCESLSSFNELDPGERRFLKDVAPIFRKHLKNSFPWSKVKVLKLSSSSMRDELLQIICMSLNQLTYLDISSCPAITKQSILMIRQCIPQIECLKLGWCSKLTDECLKIIAELKELTSLSLTHCQQITNEGLMHLSVLNSLEVLSLAHCKRISDEGVIIIVLNVHTLNYLELAGCNEVTDLSIKIIARKLTRIQYLNLSGCNKITTKSIDSLKQSCRYLTSLRYWAL